MVIHHWRKCGGAHIISGADCPKNRHKLPHQLSAALKGAPGTLDLELSVRGLGWVLSQTGNSRRIIFNDCGRPLVSSLLLTVTG